jgi:hypothetical protein
VVALNDREFYFIRHGQTDHNCGNIQGEHLDISLNETGRNQAIEIEPIIAALPLHSAYISPLKRAKETSEILLGNITLEKFEIVEFSECTVSIWNEMRQNEKTSQVCQFLQTVNLGLKQVFVKKEPSLIIAHGGIYFAICKMLGIPGDGIIDNCVPILFYFDEKTNLWKMKKCI